jgi:hypothetical protein
MHRVLVPEEGYRSVGRVRGHADEGSGLHDLSQHASAISAGAALLSFVFLRLLLRTFKLTLILGGLGALAYLAVLRY